MLYADVSEHSVRSIFIFYIHVSTYEDGTECSETSAYKLQTPVNYPEESIQQKVLCYFTLFKFLHLPEQLTGWVCVSCDT
jgi:hypothetical protein